MKYFRKLGIAFIFIPACLFSQNALLVSYADMSVWVSIQSSKDNTWEVSGNLILQKEGDVFPIYPAAEISSSASNDPLSQAVETYEEPAVKLAGFQATHTESSVLLTWTALNHKEVEEYSIQRKGTDGQWENLHHIRAQKTDKNLIDYSFEDPSPQAGSNFYRLMQRDTHGNLNYSDPLVVDRFLGGYHVTHMYPVPIIFGTSIYLHITKASKVNIVLYDGQNRPMGKVFSGQAQPGKHRIELNMDRVPQGKYRCVIEAGNSIAYREIVK